MEWRRANIVPIFKKGDKTNLQNYRRISLTSVLSKILETVVANKMSDHLEKHDLIRKTQHGFIKGRSCLTILLSFYSRVYEAIDEGGSYDIVYLDFSKAFDRVPHKRLFIKIKNHGIGGTVLKWIESWISVRQQKVCVNGVQLLVVFLRVQCWDHYFS